MTGVATQEGLGAGTTVPVGLDAYAHVAHRDVLFAIHENIHRRVRVPIILQHNYKTTHHHTGVVVVGGV